MPPDLLTARDPAEVICHRDGAAITVGGFLAQAAALAERLPDQGQAVNTCTDRYAALVAFAAALWRGHPTLLGRTGAAGEAPAAGTYILTDAQQPDAHRSGASLPVFEVDLAPVHRTVVAPAIPADRIAAIAFTSGSTGAPTAHLKPWGALVLGAAAAAARFGLRAQDGPPSSLVATVPPQHMYGFETTLMLPLHARLAIHAGASFFPCDVLDALDAVPPRRILITTPLHLRVLLAETRRPPDLAAVISATAPLSREMAEAVEREWHAPMLEIYGATEAGSMASRRSAHEEDWLPYDGIILRPGFADTPSLAEIPGLGPVPLSDALEAVGNGRFRLLGRIADLVKLGGKRASLAELNRVLAAVPGVVDGVFLAPRDLERNPAARLAAIVVAPGRTAAEILGALRDRLEPAFLPRRLEMVAALPRDHLGKLPHQALRQMVREEP
ncbi:acyl-CoA synthetase [Roseomonas frigidaquae]|uniref:Acyl-CoA synthetase n=1 Tax=Falsiroseomonas frigidaquae TaxID=487318 RepID=A0ABX1F5S0_9PROT|nr:AMP-binding protein [Falsiroseomonas frigidaquae]NKE47741.1 acyl-CoA synthetase [Falsiroseomonas frigidaquae]